jgi:histidinol-phosphatase (PHP family)
MKSGLVDYHIHSDYSIDATGTIAEFCDRALKLNLREICFTQHYDLEPLERARLNGRLVPMDSDWLDYYLDDVEKAKDAYKMTGLKIKFGVEVGCSRRYLKEIEKTLKQYSFDYVIGSIHYLDEMRISEPTETWLRFRGLNARDVCRKYYSEIERVVKTGLFDAIGHFDIYKKYGARYFGEDIFHGYEGLVESIFDDMANSNTALEVNTQCFRKGLSEPSPSGEILKIAKGRGVRIITLGSDCHSVAQLGMDLDKAVQILENAGFKQIYTFTLREGEELRLDLTSN